jgi:CheY-like chemotaxis protein
MKTVPSIVVLNSSQDTIDLLKVVLEEQGYAVATAHTSSIRNGELDVLDFVEKHSPDVIVYDVALPYERTGSSCVFSRARNHSSSSSGSSRRRTRSVCRSW